MLKRSPFLVAFFLLVSAALRAGPQDGAPYSQSIKLKVVYPNERERISYSKAPTFAIGTVSPPSAKVFVNGAEAKVEKDGAFLAFAPIIFLDKEEQIISGQDTVTVNARFTCIARYYGKEDTLVVYAFAPVPLKTSRRDVLIIDTTYSMQPDGNVMLSPHELFTVEFKGTPNCTASFDIEGAIRSIPMTETSLVDNYYWGEAVFGSGANATGDTIRGVYTGQCLLPDVALIGAKIIFHLKHEKLGELSKEAKGKLSVDNSTIVRVVEFTDSMTIARTGAELGYDLFIPRGVKAVATGKKGDWTRLKIAPTEDIWVPKNATKELPMGTPPPRSTLEVIRTKGNTDNVEVKFALHERLAYKIEQSTDPQRLIVTLYGVVSNLDWVRHDFGERSIRDITWSQLQNDQMQVTINLNGKQQWGYTVRYDGTNLLLDIKRPPGRGSRQSVLKGRTICLDPGHTPDPGAIGPRGTLEKDVNLKISLYLKRLLEQSGAKVYLTHTTDPLPLRRRRPVVVSYHPDIMISIHNNAVPDGVDPRVWNGSSTYYYHPQAYPLAYDIQEAITRELKLPNFGLYWDNLYMCRIHETISVLVEPAFIIVPEQEALLMKGTFQKRVAGAIYGGIKKFFEQNSEK